MNRCLSLLLLSSSAALAQTVGLGSPAIAAPGGLQSAAAPPSHSIELSGYVIAGGSWVQQDAQFLQVGHNNGFTLADARVELTGRPLDTVWVYLSLDGAVPLQGGTDPLQARRGVELKDAYGVWAPGYHLRVQAGQFKAPQDLEELLEETDLRFPTRSIVSRGIQPPYGYAAEGLALGRQLGISAGSDPIPLPGGLSLIAQVALTNGNGENHLVNDTQLPSVSGRLALSFGGIVSAGFDAYYQPRAYGAQPDLFRDDRQGLGADLRVEWRGAHLLALYESRSTSHLTTGGSETAQGQSVEAAYRFWFLEPALRISRLDPSSTIPYGVITELTAALNLYAASAARLSLSLTHRGEEPSRQLSNDSFDVSAQVRF